MWKSIRFSSNSRKNQLITNWIYFRISKYIRFFMFHCWNQQIKTRLYKTYFIFNIKKKWKRNWNDINAKRSTIFNQMKKLFYFEKHVKIHKTFQKLSKNIKKFSSTTKSFSDCQKSLNKSFINWKNDENSMKISFFVSSLLLFNSMTRHQIFWTVRILFCFNIFRNPEIFDIKRTYFVSI